MLLRGVVKQHARLTELPPVAHPREPSTDPMCLHPALSQPEKLPCAHWSNKRMKVLRIKHQALSATTISSLLHLALLCLLLIYTKPNPDQRFIISAARVAPEPLLRLPPPAPAEVPQAALPWPPQLLQLLAAPAASAPAAWPCCVPQA